MLVQLYRQINMEECSIEATILRDCLLVLRVLCIRYYVLFWILKFIARISMKQLYAFNLFVGRVIFISLSDLFAQLMLIVSGSIIEK